MSKVLIASSQQRVVAVVPAAGVGKRMQANCPKQYLEIHGKSILHHTVTRLLSHPNISHVVLALGHEDQYFAESELATHPDIVRVDGGKERVHSVLNALHAIDVDEYPWVLVHDAARPCVSHQDIDALIERCIILEQGGLLAAPVRDTMKRGYQQQGNTCVKHTVEREQLWHALTPQMYKTNELRQAIEQALVNDLTITDESSAIELAQLPSHLVLGSSENIKITHPDDLALAEFYLHRQSENLPKGKSSKNESL